jgi:hypothetical protein
MAAIPEKQRRARPPITPPIMAPVLEDDEPFDSEATPDRLTVALVWEVVVLAADEVRAELEENSDSKLDVVETT